MKRISEIFDYGDEIVLAGQDESIDPAKIKEMTMKKIHTSHAAQSSPRHTERKGRPAGRLILLAAVIAVILAGSALAVYQHSMQNRLATDIPLFEGKDLYHYSVSGAQEPESGSSVQTPLPETPEFLANAEWCDYLFSDHEQDFDIKLPEDSPYRAYTAWNGSAKKLQSIADRYDLRLYKEASFTNSLEVFFAFPEIGGVFMPLEGGSMPECVAQTYDDGSFLLGAVKAPVTANGTEQLVHVYIMRAMKGTLTDFTATGNSPESYICESYVTAGGTEVDLALGSSISLIFAELTGSWVTIQVSGGEVDMTVLRSLADSVDYAMLDIA